MSIANDLNDLKNSYYESLRASENLKAESRSRAEQFVLSSEHGKSVKALMSELKALETDLNKIFDRVNDVLQISEDIHLVGYFRVDISMSTNDGVLHISDFGNSKEFPFIQARQVEYFLTAQIVLAINNEELPSDNRTLDIDYTILDITAMPSDTRKHLIDELRVLSALFTDKTSKELKRMNCNYFQDSVPLYDEDDFNSEKIRMVAKYFSDMNYDLIHLD
jgi:hypothetical protein